MAGCEPIEVFLLCPIIIRPVEERNQPDRVPAERLNETRRDFALAIVISDGFAEEISAIRRAQGFKRIGVEPRSADSREDGVKQALRQNAWRRYRTFRWRHFCHVERSRDISKYF